MGAAETPDCQRPLAGTILLVDDEEQLRRIGKLILASMGFSVMTATNGREAVEKYCAGKSSIDLILMDLTMPEMDGIEAYFELRKISLSVPIAFCSGYGEDAIPSAISDDVHVGFVPKPFRPDQLRSLLKRLLQNPA
jgi:two-component system cell cycle sensor histidine kinase/response regulator CckA